MRRDLWFWGRVPYLLIGFILAVWPAGGGAAPSPLVRCDGVPKQGGASVCQVPAGSRVVIGEATAVADETGRVVVGFDRDAPARETMRVELAEGAVVEHTFEIESRTYAISRINGLPPSQVSDYSKAQLARIKASSKRKAVGDASRASVAGFAQRFEWPIKESKRRKTSGFGAQRILNGEPKRPHYGIDLAAPLGTAIHAPADGVVTLADDDLYFEGAMMVIDHGQGFLSKYLHVSRMDVKPGDHVKQGDRIGAVGSRGRSTGPHLCWRLKWRDRNLDPELWVAP